MEESPAAFQSAPDPPEMMPPLADGGRPPPSPLSGGYLLIVVGEPQVEVHKAVILQKLAKGKSSITFFTIMRTTNDTTSRISQPDLNTPFFNYVNLRVKLERRMNNEDANKNSKLKIENIRLLGILGGSICFNFVYTVFLLELDST